MEKSQETRVELPIPIFHPLKHVADAGILGNGSVEIIGEEAFIGLYSLNHIEIPDCITSIESGAFSYTGLESIQIPDTVTDIGNYLFMHCASRHKGLFIYLFSVDARWRIH